MSTTTDDDKRRDSKPPPFASPGRWSGAKERVAVVVNGRAKNVTEDLVQMLDQIVQSGDLFVSRSLEEGKDIAHMIVERGYPTVLTGGGDGTFVQMVSWVVDAAKAHGRPVPRFGFLKLGTGNAMAWVLGAQYARDKGVVADLARLRSEGGSRKLRLIEIEGLLTPFAGLGADAITLEHQKSTREMFEHNRLLRRAATGPVTYAVAIASRSVPQFLFGAMPEVRVICQSVATRLGQDGKPVGSDLIEGDVLYEGPIRLLAMSTIPYWGLGARVFPYAEERSDRFSLRIVNFGSFEAMTHLRQIWQGTYKSDRLYDFLVDAIRIECAKPTPLQIGGDSVGERSIIDAKLSEQPIDVVDYYAPPPV